MALATSAFTTYAAFGNREDLSDTIWRIDPTDTPFYSGLEREKSVAINHEWQTQALAQPAGLRRLRLGFGFRASNTAVINLLIGEPLGYNKEEGFTLSARPMGTNAAVQIALDKGELDFGIGVPSFQLPLYAKGELPLLFEGATSDLAALSAKAGVDASAVAAGSDEERLAMALLDQGATVVMVDWNEAALAELDPQTRADTEFAIANVHDAADA